MGSVSARLYQEQSPSIIMFGRCKEIFDLFSNRGKHNHSAWGFWNMDYIKAVAVISTRVSNGSLAAWMQVLVGRSPLKKDL